MTSLELLFNPTAIAIVGASKNPLKLGYEITHNIQHTIQHASTPPTLYLVNRKEAQTQPQSFYSSLKELPSPVDVVLIATPRNTVLSLIDEAAESNAKFVVVITAGFGESDEKGKQLEQQLVEKIHQYGMRLIGPNCVGYFNLSLPLNASFLTGNFPHGPISLLTQSGSFGALTLYRILHYNLGLNKFVNLGNAADLQFTDFLQYFAHDSTTTHIGIYAETMKQGRELYYTIRHLQKPVIILKGGRTTAGQKSALSHTGSLSTSHQMFKSIFGSLSNVLLVSDEQQFISQLQTLSMTATFSSQFITSEKKGTAIITNAGGPAVLLADLLDEAHVPLVENYHSTTIERIKKYFPPLVRPNNPLDLIASARGDDYKKATELLLQDPNVGALAVVCVVPTFLGMTPTEHVQGVIDALKESPIKKPIILAWFSSATPDPAVEIATQHKVPYYSSLYDVQQAFKALYG